MALAFMLPAHNFYDLFRVKTVSHSPQRVGGVEQLGAGGGGGVFSATCWREVELLISIFYYLKSVCRAEPEPPFCGQVSFFCSSSNSLNAAMKMFLVSFRTRNLLSVCLSESVCV